MIRIDLIDITIQARPYDDHTDVREFGRTLTFKNGLNLVVGDNTSGKTTIVRSLFYCLGMEELIDGKAGDRSLDKSVKDNFRYTDPNLGEKDWYINSSYVVVQLSNHKGQVLTIKRNIKSDDTHDNILSVWEAPYSLQLNNADRKEYYVHSREDHNTDYGAGFYALLSDFGDIPIVNVPGRNTDAGTKLYLQTIFGLTYIEQTRGWSDFFANIRSFNIISPKQRIIEYAMNYSMDNDMATSNSLREKKRSLEDAWRRLVDSFNSYLAYNRMFVEKLSPRIDKQEVAVEELRVAVRDKGYDIEKYREELENQIHTLNIKAEQPDNVVYDQGYNEALKEYQEHKKDYQNFCLELADEKRKLDNIQHQIAMLDDEIKRYQSLAKVNNIVSNLEIRQCPTCHQSLPLQENTFVVSEEVMQRSVKVYEMQKKFLKPMAEKLEASIKNQEMNKLYLENQLAIELARVEAIAASKQININPLTVEDQYVLVNSRTRLALLDSIASHIKQVKQSLTALKENYGDVCQQLADQKDKNAQITPLDKQLERFCSLLQKFGYSSNRIGSIAFSEEKNTYQYLPVIVQGEDYREEIRSDSSASDFIRSIWAYYITLLMEGRNHPGFLVMDEPCQHSMKEESLKRLFEVCSQLTNKQVILFCSSQPRTEEFENSQRNGEANETTNVIQAIVNSMNKVSLNYLVVDPKSIVEKMEAINE